MSITRREKAVGGVESDSLKGLVGLVTDFGRRDPYAAIMEGVIRVTAPSVQVTHLTHEIGVGNVFEAAMWLDYACQYLRNDSLRTVVCAVVDPGVGTERRIVAARLEQLWLVGPDNGIFGTVLGPRDAVHEVERRDLFRGESTTFHGRDRFAPVAAEIAAGLEIEGLGRKIDREALVGLDYDPPVYGGSQVAGRIVSIDRFGNVITDLEASRIDLDRPLALEIGETRIGQMVKTYEEIPEEQLCMIVGSRGTIEVSAKGHSAATILQPEARAGVTVRLGSTGE